MNCSKANRGIGEGGRARSSRPAMRRMHKCAATLCHVTGSTFAIPGNVSRARGRRGPPQTPPPPEDKHQGNGICYAK